jgi:rhodanese-related sulfurtransferase
VGVRKVSDKDLEVIELAELRELMSEEIAKDDATVLYLIDPRSGDRFAEGHLPMAQNRVLSQVPIDAGRDPRIAVYDHIVVYGNDPGSTVARAMAKRLMSLRYKGVRWYREGVSEWVGAGLPIVTASGGEAVDSGGVSGGG